MARPPREVYRDFTDADALSTWFWPDRIRLEKLASGTRVTVRHSGNPDETTRDEHRTGWNDCLSRLAAKG